MQTTIFRAVSFAEVDTLRAFLCFCSFFVLFSLLFYSVQIRDPPPTCRHFLQALSIFPIASMGKKGGRDEFPAGRQFYNMLKYMFYTAASMNKN